MKYLSLRQESNPWIERPPGVWEVMSSILVGDADFSLSHHRVNDGYRIFKEDAESEEEMYDLVEECSGRRIFDIKSLV